MQCLNPDCGLLWLNPMPLEEDIGKAYEYYYTHGDEEQSLMSAARPGRLRETIRGIALLRRLGKLLRSGFFASAYGYTDGVSRFQRVAGNTLYLYPFLTRLLAKEIGYIHCLPHGRLLEVGCASGSYLETMQRLGWEVEGVEVDPRSSELARQHGLAVHSGTLEQRRFEDCRFDVIVLSHLLEHVHDPAAVLQECYRILKPVGSLRFLCLMQRASAMLGLRKRGWAWIRRVTSMFLLRAHSGGSSLRPDLTPR